MKATALAAAVLLAGCETVATIAPHTVADFEEGGVVGAIDGASDALLARCRMLDGRVVRVAIDSLATATRTEDWLDGIRETRQRACAVVGAVQAIVGDEFETPYGRSAGPVTIHRDGHGTEFPGG